MTRLVSVLVATGALAFASPTLAQTAPPSDTEPASGTAGVGANAGASAPAAAVTVSPDGPQYPRFGRSTEHSLGARLWAFYIPPAFVQLFTHIEPGFGGALNIAAGPEYVYRHAGLDIILGIQYTGFQAPAGYFRGNNEQDIALEQVISSLYVVYANAIFLWGTRVNDWFEFQYGVGVGLGYVGGNLQRIQAYRDSTNTPQPCIAPGNPSPTYCGNDNNHYNGYNEPRLTDNPSGSIPPVIPWISLPHLAAHFRPHRNFDVRVDLGYALLGFYSGVALHYVFN